LEDDRIDDAYDRVQGQFDHIHCDLVDASFSENAPAVAIEKLHKARALCTWHPLCLHLMSKTPLLWMEQCWDLVDWFVIHVDIEDDVMDVIARCREHGKKIGVTWHHSVSVAQLISYLPHVDFVMILGIDKPGHSNQEIMDSAIEAAFLFDELSSRYGYRVMFDGGVTTENAHHIPATHIVSSSTVLQAENPIQNALTLMWGDPRERK
jgi:ribulose-phosphate 3-epimerase